VSGGPAGAAGSPAGGRCGLVALGDSITNGHGEPMLGVHAQSWAQWLAQALDVPFHGLAADGARAADVLREQVPRLRGPYEVGVVFAGVNDARAEDWDAAAFERDLRAIAAAVGEVAGRLVLLTLPQDLGRPPAGTKPRAVSAIVRRVAAEAGADVVELGDLAGRRLVLPDAVHPTALGQVVIAERAAAALRAGGGAVAGSPLAMAGVDRTARARARWRLRAARLHAQDLRRRALERARPPGPGA
jgi:lysophospholipase L1-like esterase